MNPDVVEVEAPDEAAPSLREALEAAFDEPATPPAPVADDVTAPAEPPADETPAQAAQRARDESGKFTKQPKAPKPAVEAQKPVLAPPKVAPPVDQAKPPAPDLKAPSSWKPLAREAWGQAPEAIRAEVLRREKEVAQALEASAEDRKFAGTLRETLRPYEAQIRAEGSTPERAVGNLLQTAMALRTAPPHHKAGLVAGIIRDYGVPLEGLVAALQGQPVPQGQHQTQFDPAQLADQVQERLMAKLRAEKESALMERAGKHLEAFLGDKEFAAELREDMADIIDRAARRGRQLTLEQAYQLAAKEHPEVSKVFEQREAFKAQASRAQTAQRSRAAASSVRSSPALPPNTGPGAKDLRSALEAAFDSDAGR